MFPSSHVWTFCQSTQKTYFRQPTMHVKHRHRTSKISKKLICSSLRFFQVSPNKENDIKMFSYYVNLVLKHASVLERVWEKCSDAVFEVFRQTFMTSGCTSPLPESTEPDLMWFVAIFKLTCLSPASLKH